MSNTKFFNDAIAEAKAIRETALANAKLALEEAFQPKIQSMLEKQMQNEAELDEDIDEAKDLDEKKHDVDEAKKDVDEAKEVDEAKKDMDEKKDMEEAKDMDEAKKDVDEAKKDVDEAKADVDEAKKDMDEKKDVDEAKKDMDEAADIDEDMYEEGSIEEIDLEELLAELEEAEKAEEGKKEVDETVDEGSIDEGFDPIAMEQFLTGLAGAGALVGGSAALTRFMDKATAGEYGPKAKKVADWLEKRGAEAGAAMRSETINENDFPVVEAEAEDEVGEITVDELKDIIRDVLSDVMGGGEEEEMDMDMDVDAEGGDEIDIEMDAEEEEMVDEKKDVEEVRAELNEAIKVINTLKSELNEVNLLNAKLLYVNKLFKSKTLNEAQKVKVINAFDRAETLKEVKNVFETLKENLSVKTRTLKEHKSFASKAAGVAPKKEVITEGADFVTRMQKLAGII